MWNPSSVWYSYSKTVTVLLWRYIRMVRGSVCHTEPSSGWWLIFLQVVSASCEFTHSRLFRMLSAFIRAMIFSVIPSVASSMILFGTSAPRQTPSHGLVDADDDDDDDDDGWLKYPMMTPSPRLTANTTEMSRRSLTLVQSTSLLIFETKNFKCVTICFKSQIWCSSRIKAEDSTWNDIRGCIRKITTNNRLMFITI